MIEEEKMELEISSNKKANQVVVFKEALILTIFLVNSLDSKDKVVVVINNFILILEDSNNESLKLKNSLNNLMFKKLIYLL